MSSYQVISRKFRPQFFREVMGQEAIVLTLRQAIKMGRVGHAYLFSGSRGTGKTTLARLFAKAINCKSLQEDGEPCNACSSCEEIARGSSLDVLEIDGASHRGIEDIRRLHETLGLLPLSSPYKIYIIDEVHMLTKEAFNALLKSLEEPPPHVKFFFATTEPEKLPPTIVSRCQRFQLNRLSDELIVKKLKKVAGDLKLEVEETLLPKLARLSQGSVRDAESLFDELATFFGASITKKGAEELLGLISIDLFFEMDSAIAREDMGFLFTMVERMLSSGKSIGYFVEELITHFRTLLLLKRKISLPLTDQESQSYKNALSVYSEENCLDILELLSDAISDAKLAFSERSFLELLLLRLFRIPKKPSFESLVKRLEDLEKRNVGKKEEAAPPQIVKKETPIKESKPVQVPLKEERALPPPPPVKEEKAIPTAPKEEKAAPPPPKEEKKEDDPKKKSRNDTLTRFAAVELSGNLKIEKTK